MLSEHVPPNDKMQRQTMVHEGWVLPGILDVTEDTCVTIYNGSVTNLGSAVGLPRNLTSRSSPHLTLGAEQALSHAGARLGTNGADAPLGSIEGARRRRHCDGPRRLGWARLRPQWARPEETEVREGKLRAGPSGVEKRVVGCGPVGRQYRACRHRCAIVQEAGFHGR